MTFVVGAPLNPNKQTVSAGHAPGGLSLLRDLSQKLQIVEDNEWK